MIHIIGASSLNATIKRVPYKFRRNFFNRSYSLGGLSFNWNAKNPLKVLQNLLTGRSILARKYKVIIWHDIINNSISKREREKAKRKKESAKLVKFDCVV